jgi:hypothetical protein
VTFAGAVVTPAVSEETAKVRSTERDSPGERSKAGVGDGTDAIGAFWTFAAAEQGVDVTVVDPDRERLALADALTATRTLLVEPGGQAAGGGGPSGGIGRLRVARGPRVCGGDAAEGWAPRASRLAQEVAGVRAARADAHEIEIIGKSTVNTSAFVVTGGLQPLIDGRADRIKTLIDPWAQAARPTAMRTPAPIPGLSGVPRPRDERSCT